MKKIIAGVAALVVLIVGISFMVREKPSEQYLRIHIRANSDLTVDQNVKYKVKNTTMTALSAVLPEIRSKAEMMDFLKGNLAFIEGIINEKLRGESSDYAAKVSLRKEQFPARTYGDLTLVAGVYDALIVELGKAEGANWWCVVYPQICFADYEKTDKKDFEYASRLYEILHKGK